MKMIAEGELRLNFGNDIVTLEIQKELGRGAFGIVSLATDKETLEQYAVKRSQCIDANTYFAAAAEIQALMKLDHVNVAKMKAFDFDQNNALIVMEYCNEGDLNQRLCRGVEEDTKFQWIRQLFDAMIHLHKMKIVHRDLKPENVLLHNNTLKLTDFGISRYYNTDTLTENNLSQFLGTFAGTPYWVAPEVFDRQYTETADVFSVGILCYAILHQESMVYKGQKYFGIFVPHNNQPLVGLGLVMFEENREISPSKKYTKNPKMNDLVCALVRMRPLDRPSLENAMQVLIEILNGKKEEDNKQPQQQHHQQHQQQQQHHQQPQQQQQQQQHHQQQEEEEIDEQNMTWGVWVGHKIRNYCTLV